MINLFYCVLNSPDDDTSHETYLARGSPLPCLATGGITNCTLHLVSTGNVGLQNITVPDQGSGCPMVSYLAPGADHNCTMSRSVSQSNFDDWDTNGTRLFLQASVTALPTGVVATAQVSNYINGTIPLLSRPSLIKVSAVVSPNSIWHPGKGLCAACSMDTFRKSLLLEGLEGVSESNAMN